MLQIAKNVTSRAAAAGCPEIFEKKKFLSFVKEYISNNITTAYYLLIVNESHWYNKGFMSFVISHKQALLLFSTTTTLHEFTTKCCAIFLLEELQLMARTNRAECQEYCLRVSRGASAIGRGRAVQT